MPGMDEKTYNFGIWVAGATFRRSSADPWRYWVYFGPLQLQTEIPGSGSGSDHSRMGTTTLLSVTLEVGLAS